MPELARPDGARIHYEVRGDGPLVVFALGFAATPATYAGLADDLARDHRVLTWEPRGCGESSGDGPFDLATDAADMVALIHEIGAPACAWAVGHGVNVAARAARLDRDAVASLVSPGIVTALRDHLEGAEGFAASPEVMEMLVEQMRRDPRGATRATIDSLNPQFSEEELRARVDETLAYSAPETILARIESWLADDGALDDIRQVGTQLALVWHADDDWQAGSIPRVRELLPGARLIEVENGPLSRPDLAANVVREMA